MKKIERVLNQILGVVSTLCLFGIAVTVLIQIISRTFLPQSPAWTEEVSRFFFVSGVFYATGLAKGRNAYVNVDILEQKLQPTARKIYLVFINAIIFVFNLIVFVQSIGFVQSGADFIADTIPITMNYIYFGTVASSFFIMVYTLFDIINTLTAKNDRVGDQK